MALLAVAPGGVVIASVGRGLPPRDAGRRLAERTFPTERQQFPRRAGGSAVMEGIGRPAIARSAFVPALTFAPGADPALIDFLASALVTRTARLSR